MLQVKKHQDWFVRPGLNNTKRATQKTNRGTRRRHFPLTWTSLHCPAIKRTDGYWKRDWHCPQTALRTIHDKIHIYIYMHAVTVTLFFLLPEYQSWTCHSFSQNRAIADKWGGTLWNSSVLKWTITALAEALNQRNEKSLWLFTG